MQKKIKDNVKQKAYDKGLRCCPCCNVQLVWKAANVPDLQKNLATVDHILPKSFCGSNAFENLYIMCRKCNTDRGAQSFVKFVTKKGVAKDIAEDIYKKAHVMSLQHIIKHQFSSKFSDSKSEHINNKTQRSRVRKIINNYKEHFGHILPEFSLFEQIL